MRIRLVIGSLIALAAAAPSRGETPLGTAFTYQGQLKQGGAPLEGTADFQFTLWDAAGSGNPPTGGVQVGGVQAINALPVTAGLFTVTLNGAGVFGGNAFNGNARWVQVAVRSPAGIGAFTTLAPRQPLNATPYAFHALNAPDGHSLDAADGTPTDVVFVDNVGNVGIGTITPDNTLHVQKGSAGTITGNANAPLVVENSGNTYVNILAPDANESAVLFGRPGSGIPTAAGGIVFNSATNADGLQFRTFGNLTRMTIDSGGDVGIGTTTPGFPLTFPNALGDKISLWGQSGAHYGFGIQNALLQVHTDSSASDIAFGYGTSAAFTERMRIKGGGNVGLGTASPTHLLHVFGAARFRSNASTNLLLTGSNDDAFIDFIKEANTTPSARIKMDGFADQATHRAFMEFFTRGASDSDVVSRMRITDTGDVGIGTTLPTARLDVEDEGSGETVARFHKSAAGTHTSVIVDSLAGQDPIYYLAENGAVTWGIRSDTDASHPGAFQIRSHAGGANDRVVEIYKATNTEWVVAVDGHIQPEVDTEYDLGSSTRRWTSLYASNPVIQTSDARQKKDVAILDYGLKELLSLRPVRYKWKKESDPRVYLGLISQEVEPIVPEAVVKDAANPETPWALTYTTFIPILIRGAQEQQSIIEKQHEKIESLQSRLEALEHAVQALAGPQTGGVK